MSSKTAAKTSKNEELLEKAIEYKQNRQFAEAEKILKKIVKSDPKNLKAMQFIAEVQSDSKRHDAALNTLAKIVRIDPTYHIAWRHLGFLEMHAKSNLMRALECFSRALELNPSDPEIYYLMGYLSQLMNQYDDSIELFEIGLKLAPLHAEMNAYLGMSFIRQRRFDEAKEKMFYALSLNPHNTNILMNVLQAEEVLTFDEEQKDKLQKVLEMQTKNPNMSDMINLRLGKILIGKKDYEKAMTHLKKIDDDKNKLGSLKYFEIAKIYRSQGDTEKAFEMYEKANELQGAAKQASKYNKSAILNVMQSQINLLDEKFAEKLEIQIFQNEVPDNYPQPVFLTGFPRSGTTLTGTILDHHPKLITADEYGAVDQCRLHFLQKFSKQLPACLIETSKEELKFLKDLYNVKQDNIPLQNPDKIMVDKLPLNSMNGILIHTMFPKSKILFVRRHPLDSILSGYMQSFAMNSAMVHFNDIKDMAILYKTMTEQWESQKKYLNIDYYEARYENIVENFDEEVGQILDFIGVGWDDNVRDFYKNTDGPDGPKTLTPSRSQVNKTLYKGAQNRWKKYEKHLQPAIDILGDTIEELGYEL